MTERYDTEKYPMDRDAMKHESLDCTDMKALLSAYIDDEMDRPTRHLAERHLAECDACRAIVNEAEGLDDLIAIDAESREQLIRLSNDFQEQVLARTAYARRPPTRFRWTMWTGWMTAAACLGLAAVIWMGHIPVPGEHTALQDSEGEQTDQVDVQSRDDAIDDADEVPATARSPVIRPAAYTTGLDLQSETYEGTLPAEMFQLAVHSRSTLLPRPGAGWVRPQQDQLSSAPDKSADAPDGDGTVHPDLVEQLTLSRQQRLREPDPAVISREDSETLHSTALLLELLEGIDLSNFAEVEWMRQVIEADDLLDRLLKTRGRVGIQHRPTVYAAEAIMHRIADGPLDRDDVEGLRATVLGLELAEEIGRLSRRPDDAPSL